MGNLSGKLAMTAPECADLITSDLQLRLIPFLGIARIQLREMDAQAHLLDTYGAPLPEPGRFALSKDLMLSWLGPGEWLATGEINCVDDFVTSLDCGLPAHAFAMITDYTHGRAALSLEGSNARDTLGALCPLDLSDLAFPIGSTGRSLMGDAGLFIARKQEGAHGPSFVLIVDQTMASYAYRTLAASATSIA